MVCVYGREVGMLWSICMYVREVGMLWSVCMYVYMGGRWVGG